jgi:K+-transporting ATPase A subunit
VALTGLHVSSSNNTETVVGIKELIEGLAGKFVSSIIGLALSIAFVLIERKWCERRLSNAYEDLLEATSRLIPALTATRIQLDVHTVAARQNESLENLNSRIAAFLSMVSVANESVPRMAAALAGDVEQFSDRLEGLSNTLNKSILRLRQ